MSTAQLPMTDLGAFNVETTSPQIVDKEFVRKLRNDTCAVRVHIRKFGIRKALSADQVEQAADVFSAEQDVLRATKKLLDTKGEEWNAVLRVLYQAKLYWRYSSIPYTEPGWRLIRRSKIDAFRGRMVEFVADLEDAKGGLAAVYEQLKEQAREKLGALYNPEDYPARIDTLFSLEWDFPSVEPPEYLKQLNPDLYEQQIKLVESRFEQSLANAEQLLTEELQQLVAHLADKLKPGEDGQKKVIRTSAVENLLNFFGKFSELKITSNGVLNEIVARAQDLVSGVSVEELKKGTPESRRSLAESMEAIKAEIDSLIVNAPRRKINLSDDE